MPTLEVNQVPDSLSCWLIHTWIEWNHFVLLQLLVALVFTEDVFLCSVVIDNLAEDRLQPLEVLPDESKSVLSVVDFILQTLQALSDPHPQKHEVFLGSSSLHSKWCDVWLEVVDRELIPVYFHEDEEVLDFYRLLHLVVVQDVVQDEVAALEHENLVEKLAEHDLKSYQVHIDRLVLHLCVALVLVDKSEIRRLFRQLL